MKVRSLLQHRSFTIVTLLTLAIGIGANTAMFSVVNSVLLRPLPFDNPDRLMTLWERTRQGTWEVSYPNFVDWRERSRSFDSIAAYRQLLMIVSNNDEPARVPVALVSLDLFHTLGAMAQLGRTFVPEEDRAGAQPVAIISHGRWQASFGSAPDVLGRSVTINGQKFSVVGV
ncbi:MAG: ABC transporter permease, partial [Phycisphaerales bacterium]|nr:ABC transporter permease [Phycisphaerales bacterium]